MCDLLVNYILKNVLATYLPNFFIYIPMYVYHSLSLSVTTRMTTNNDVPMLICQLLNVKPWIKLENDKKYIFQGSHSNQPNY